MNHPQPVEAGAISIGALRDFDQICDGFERAWRDGGRPRLDDFLPALPEPALSELIRQLLLVEIEQRTSRGDTPPFPEYAGRFPTLVAWLSEVMRGGIANPSPNVAGSIVGRSIGQYAVIDKLGEGGMGAVYRVRHTMIPCERALKVLKPGLARNRLAIQRFLIEAQACIGLTHPNVVATYDVGQESDGTVFLVMELLDGQNLDELVRAAGPLEYVLAAEIIRQAAAGLETAHRHGTVHRDVKPHNIMWTGAKSAKILDLGLARIMDDPTEVAGASTASGDRPFDALLSRYETRLTDGRSMLGTLAYISPEQATDARQADAQSDVYSLGCTFYYLLTGRHAFTGQTPVEVLNKHLAGDYAPIANHRPDIPPCGAIAARMMHSDRARRYASADDVQKALQNWLTPSAPRPVRITPFNLDDPESMRDALTSLRIISEDEWNTARIKAQRASASPETGRSRPVPAMFGRKDQLSPGMMILLQLWRLRNEPGGQRHGLSEFQIQYLLNGHIDLLRLPHHVLLAQIGSGWKGEAFMARNQEADRDEAVRTMPPRMLEGLPGEGKERIPALVGEVGQLQKLDHPALAKVYSAGSYETRIDGDLAYLAAEFIVGQTLARRSANDRAARIGSTDAKWGAAVIRGVSRFFDGGSRRAADDLWGAAVIREVCRGLEYAHENGILHLDIHAGAIIIDRADRPRLLDLGVARLMTPGAIHLVSSTETLMQSDDAPAQGAGWKPGSFGLQALNEVSLTVAPPPPIGTPEVMPPEQWRDREDVSAATDIYNVGCTLFFAMTGEYPFTGKSALELMQQHLRSAPLERPAAKQIPRKLRPVLEKCLAKEPRERFRSVKELGRALDGILGD